MFLCLSESFIDIENKCSFSTPDSKIEADVCPILEFPTVAYSPAGKYLTASEA